MQNIFSLTSEVPMVILPIVQNCLRLSKINEEVTYFYLCLHIHIYLYIYTCTFSTKSQRKNTPIPKWRNRFLVKEDETGDPSPAVYALNHAVPCLVWDSSWIYLLILWHTAHVPSLLGHTHHLVSAAFFGRYLTLWCHLGNFRVQLHSFFLSGPPLRNLHLQHMANFKRHFQLCRQQGRPRIPCLQKCGCV